MVGSMSSPQAQIASWLKNILRQSLTLGHGMALSAPRMRMQRLEDIKNRKAAARGGSEEPPSGASERVDAEGSNGQQGDGAPEATEDVGSLAEYTAELLGMPSAPDGLGLLAAPQRKKRVIDTLRELLPGSDESEGSDEEGEDPVLDWRSKGV